MIKVCLTCSKEFNARRNRIKYCSHNCYAKRIREKIFASCLQCGKQFRTSLYFIRYGRGKFCSKNCHNLSQSKKTDRVCQVCGTNFVVSPSIIKYSGAKYCSHSCMWKGQKGQEKPSIQGDKHLNWKNGASRQLYPLKFNEELKEQIRKRDDYFCQLCNLQDEEHILVYGYSLMIHHIDYIKDNCEESNLISLCNQCHGRTNYNRTYWTEFLSQKLKEKCNEKVI